MEPSKKRFSSDLGAAAAGAPHRHRAKRRSTSANSVCSPTLRGPSVASGQAQFQTPPARAHVSADGHGKLSTSRVEGPTSITLQDGSVARKRVSRVDGASTSLRKRAQLLASPTRPVRTAARMLVPTSATVPVAATCLVPTAIAPDSGECTALQVPYSPESLTKIQWNRSPDARRTHWLCPTCEVAYPHVTMLCVKCHAMPTCSTAAKKAEETRMMANLAGASGTKVLPQYLGGRQQQAYN